MILAAGLEGIREVRWIRGQPHRENMYNYSDKEVRRRWALRCLPQKPGRGRLNALKPDPLVPMQVFGEAMFETFVQFKREEWDQLSPHVLRVGKIQSLP